MEGYQQLFALTKNSKYAPPEKRAVIKIEQYCKRRKDRMKPKWREDSSCVFACRFCRGTCHRRDTAGKENAPKSLQRRSGKRSFVKAVGTIRQENRQRPGVRGCSHEQRSKTSTPQRTDLAQVKRDRHTGRPWKTRNIKASRLRQSNSSAEIRRKRLSLPTGEVRPSEHDYDYKELF